MSREGRRKTRRSYSPAVEALEALRLLDQGAAPLLPHVPVEIDSPALPGPLEAPNAGHDAWDAVLVDWHAELPAEPDVDAGLAQLNRYLSRAWARAGIAPDQHDDCTQAVYVTLLQNLGRDGFDRVMAEVAAVGVRQVFSRETTVGPDFFRAVDMVKKRAVRQKSFSVLDTQADLAGGRSEASDGWRGALHEAIVRTLNRRETELIHATLMGNSPAEIALLWGVAPKTVSNEKTRVLAKLRAALTSDLDN